MRVKTQLWLYSNKGGFVFKRKGTAYIFIALAVEIDRTLFYHALAVQNDIFCLIDS